MKIADLYIRVSTDEQADKGYSQRGQEDVLSRYCEINGIKVRKILFEDHSAKTFERPQWKSLLYDLKKYRGKSNLVLFTKWDRFSRNASDAYQMISILGKLGVEPQAIEQPLDMSIPENKMMLAVYLTAPEIENDRRSLNVKHGMRQARKEGRFMGIAPPGYSNKIRDNGDKYVAIDETQAKHVKWAFETLAEGVYTTKDVWKLAKERGLLCSLHSFWTLIKNVAYCGKIQVPKYKNEEAYLVQGQHEGIISESLFYKVQDVLNGRQRDIGINSSRGTTVTSPEMLPLRGFLLCDRCGKTITGSASKGCRNYFYYYHCYSGCKWRQKAEVVNMAFVKLLRQFYPKPGVTELFKGIVSEVYSNANQLQQSVRRKTISEITANNNRITKARELLLDDSIGPEDYKVIKSKAEEKIRRLEAKLNELSSVNKYQALDIDGLIYKTVENLKNLDLLYLNSDIQGKKEIISSMSSKKWRFENGELRTTEMNQAISLIYLINKRLNSKKTRLRPSQKSQSGFVPKRRFELPHPYRRQPLKLVRLPIPPPG